MADRKLFALSCLLIPSLAQADDFTGFSMDFVPIGDAGNAADNTGYGSVGYGYRMGVNEVSRAAIDSYNANSGGPTITMFDMTSFGGNGSAKPATGVSWNEAARFVNWLNTSQGHSEAYNFTTGGANDNITLWTPGEAGYGSTKWVLERVDGFPKNQCFVLGTRLADAVAPLEAGRL